MLGIGGVPCRVFQHRFVRVQRILILGEIGHSGLGGDKRTMCPGHQGVDEGGLARSVASGDKGAPAGLHGQADIV